MWSPMLKAQIIDMPSDQTELDIGDFEKGILLTLLQTIYPPNKPISLENVSNFRGVLYKPAKSGYP